MAEKGGLGPHLVSLSSSRTIGGKIHGKCVRPGQRGVLVPPLTHNLKLTSRLDRGHDTTSHEYLSHIETENEVERKIVLVFVCKHAEPLKGLFGIFVIDENHPVDKGDEAVEDAVGDEGLPDALVYAACPEEQDSVEAKARGLEVVEVCYSHCATRVS